MTANYGELSIIMGLPDYFFVILFARKVCNLKINFSFNDWP